MCLLKELRFGTIKFELYVRNYTELVCSSCQLWNSQRWSLTQSRCTEDFPNIIAASISLARTGDWRSNQQPSQELNSSTRAWNLLQRFSYPTIEWLLSVYRAALQLSVSTLPTWFTHSWSFLLFNTFQRFCSGPSLQDTLSAGASS